MQYSLDQWIISGYTVGHPNRWHRLLNSEYGDSPETKIP